MPGPSLCATSTISCKQHRAEIVIEKTWRRIHSRHVHAAENVMSLIRRCIAVPTPDSSQPQRAACCTVPEPGEILSSELTLSTFCAPYKRQLRQTFNAANPTPTPQTLQQQPHQQLLLQHTSTLLLLTTPSTSLPSSQQTTVEKGSSRPHLC
jgi:hypothetical protein